MITALSIWIITLADKILFSWWLDPYLSYLQRLIQAFDLIDSWFSVIINAFRYITFFIPTTHLIIFTGVFVAVTMVKVFMSIYHQVAQVIP